MPYPSEHAARINDPSKYKALRRQNDRFGPGIHVIWGILPDGRTEIQAIRFDKTKFTPDQARAWLKEHDYKPIEFAPATGTAMEVQYWTQLSEVGDGGWIDILYPGKFRHALYGEFNITEADLQHALDNFKKGIATKEYNGKRVLSFGYQHAESDPDPEKAKNSGICVDMRIKDGKLQAKVEWTSKALEYIKNKEFLWFSPEFDTNWKDEEGNRHGFTIIGGSLTNIPFLKRNQMAIAATEKAAYFVEPEGAEMSEQGDFKEWDTKYVNDLPDDAFAYIRPGGEKDEEGKTKPRSLRFLPYKDKNGDIDLPHLRNALARLPQTSLTPDEQAKARAVLIRAAREAGVGNYIEDLLTEQEKGEMKATETIAKLTELLQLDDDADVIQTVRELTEKNAEMEKKIQELSDKGDGGVKLSEEEYKALKAKAEAGVEALERLRKRDIDDLLNGAIEQGKITPAERDVYAELAERDFEMAKKLIEKAPKRVNFGPSGSPGKSPKASGSDRIHSLVETKQREKPELSYKQALDLVLMENPDLKGAYEPPKK